MHLSELVTRIRSTHETLRRRVAVVAAVGLTARNWLIGAYIVEFEQQGEDRARYGETLVRELARRLRVKGLSETALKLSRQFYLVYPGIGPALIDQYGDFLGPRARQKGQTASDLFQLDLPALVAGAGDGSLAAPRSQEASPPPARTSRPGFAVPPERLVEQLSFSHFVELLKIDDPQKRAFYEIEAIKGLWSVRELKRQVGSLLYERTGLSTDQDRLLRLVADGAEAMRPGDVIRDPYVFEFLGLRPGEVVRESDLEAALLDQLQSFLLELGRGFCFEERQKRLRIGRSDFFVDLVFYHRILKCHVLVELKVEPFNHAGVGQLNTYLAYFRRHEMVEGDRPPVGLLLCTGKDQALVEYALGGLSEPLFVSEYRVGLPDEDSLRRLIEREARQLSSGASPSSFQSTRRGACGASGAFIPARTSPGTAPGTSG